MMGNHTQYAGNLHPAGDIPACRRGKGYAPILSRALDIDVFTCYTIHILTLPSVLSPHQLAGQMGGGRRRYTG